MQSAFVRPIGLTHFLQLHFSAKMYSNSGLNLIFSVLNSVSINNKKLFYLKTVHSFIFYMGMNYHNHILEQVSRCMQITVICCIVIWWLITVLSAVQQTTVEPLMMTQATIEQNNSGQGAKKISSLSCSKKLNMLRFDYFIKIC